MASWPCSSNRRMFDIFLKIMREEMADVKFIFESNSANSDVTGSPAKKIARRGKSTINSDDGRVIEILAHKKVLAASSPVFNAMFYGELKETGDIRIEDTSADGFREFLQIFYNDEIKLTIENLNEVMTLIDKYDVTNGWPHVDAVFKSNLAVADVLWGLNLAVKFRRDNLIKLCTDLIEQNCAAVCNMIDFDDSGKPKLRRKPNNRPMSDADLAIIYSHVHASIKKYTSKSEPIIISIKFQQIFGPHTIDKIEGISFSSNCTLLLTHIIYSEIYTKDSRGSVKIRISIADNVSHYTIPRGGGTMKYLNPILIQPNRKYSIQTEIIKHLFSPKPFFDAYKTPDGSVQVAPSVQIKFDKACYGSIVAALNFLRYDH